MSLGDFLNEGKYGGSWADEVEDSYGSQPLPAASSSRMGGGYSSYSGGGSFADRGYSVRESSFPTELPTKPPYTAHLGNLSYDATSETVSEFFEGCDLTSVRIIEDRIENRPKGFAYAEFKDVEGLKRALELDGEQFQGRNIRVKIADPPKNDRGMGDRDRGGESALNLSSWERKGPLAALPGREPERRNDFGGERRDFGERRNDFGGERRAPREFAPADENKGRDFSNLSWERRGPLSPVPQPERSSSRASSRPGVDDGNRADSFRERKGRAAPAWGEGRPEGSRPPREHSERPDRPERTPTAAELDNKWRSNMRPDAKSPEAEAPASPSAAPAAPAGRPRLNLQKRTVSEAPGVTSPATASAPDAKGNPFGAARPIDTAARERDLLLKKEQAAKEKAEAEEKAKEERRLAKEAAAEEAAQKAAAAAEAEKEAAEKAEKEAAEKAANAEAEPAKTEEAPKETEAEGAGEQKALPSRPRESAPKSRAAESGSWRAAGDSRSARGGGYQNAPRGRGEYRGGRGGGRGRGDRGSFGEGRGHRANGSQGGQQSVPSTPITEEPATPQDPDGWQTVSKGRRGRA